MYLPFTKRTTGGLVALAGLVVGAVAFGMWQQSVWAGIFIFAVECGVHYEATRREVEEKPHTGKLCRFWEI